MSRTIKFLAPQGFPFERLEKRHARGLKFEKDLLDFLRRCHGEGSGKQLLSVPQRRVDDRPARRISGFSRAASRITCA